MNIYTNKETEKIILREASAEKASKSKIVRDAVKLYSDFKKNNEFKKETDKIKSDLKTSTRELAEILDAQTDRLAKLIFKIGILAGQNLYEQSYQLEQTFFKKSDGSVNEIKSKDFSKIARNWAVEFMKKSIQVKEEKKEE